MSVNTICEKNINIKLRYKCIMYFKKKVFKPSAPEHFTKTTEQWLLIVESPSKCSKIEHYLGNKYKCIASKGHLRELKGLKCINTKTDFSPTFTNISIKKSHIEFMKTVISQFSNNQIILATDDDREGEAIAWHICELFNLPVETTRRILFHEVTATAIIDAVEHPTLINMNIVFAQHARQVLDVLIGYKISPLLWKYMFNSKENSLSAGRCQTPALRLIYDNEKELTQGNGIEMKYKVIGNFFGLGLDFVLDHEFENKDLAINFLKKSMNFIYKFTVGSPKNSIKSPPQPFNTSNLLQTASNTLVISPKETMSICQNLYQNGHITYMRTESRKYSMVFINEVKSYIEGEYGSSYLGNVSKITNIDNSKPHEAIRVTHLNIHELSDETGRTASLYKLIWKNTIQSCMVEAKYQTIEIVVSPKIEQIFLYKHSIETPMFLGWKKCGNNNPSLMVDCMNKMSGILMHIKSTDSNNVLCNNIHIGATFHNKHTYYTESSLIQKLENLGIGRPSTYSLFIETIQERGYIKKMDIEGTKLECLDMVLENNKITTKSVIHLVGNSKSKLKIQPIGLLIIEFLIKNCDELFNYDYTSKLEEKLDIISVRETDISSFPIEICKDCNDILKLIVKELSNKTKESFVIDDKHTFTFTKNGPAIQYTSEEGEIKYLSLKKDISLDIEKLRNKEYNLDDLIESPNRCLGKWEGVDIYIKRGKFGNYIEWGEEKKTCEEYKKSFDEITIEDIPNILVQPSKKVALHTLRIIDSNISIRRGRFGPYIFYQTPIMSKPQFLSIKGLKEGFSLCKPQVIYDWLSEKHNIIIS